MTDKTVMPVYALRSYTWALLQANDPGTWDESKYGGLVPIVPLNEEPELGEYDGPRIVYDYSLGETGTAYFRGRGTMTFAVRDSNYRRLTRTMNIMVEAFKRHDEAAADVNDYVYRMTQKQVDPVVFDVSFGFIRLAFAESGTPEVEEGGPMIGVVSITFDYFDNYSLITRPPV